MEVDENNNNNTAEEQTESIDISQLNSGMYILELTIDDNKISKRFVKN